VVAGCCTGLQIPHKQRVFCSLQCLLLQSIACGLGSIGVRAESLALEIFSNSREPLPKQ
jgi:hypothetical protein